VTYPNTSCFLSGRTTWPPPPLFTELSAPLCRFATCTESTCRWLSGSREEEEVLDPHAVLESIRVQRVMYLMGTHQSGSGSHLSGSEPGSMPRWSGCSLSDPSAAGTGSYRQPDSTAQWPQDGFSTGVCVCVCEVGAAGGGGGHFSIHSSPSLTSSLALKSRSLFVDGSQLVYHGETKMFYL